MGVNVDAMKKDRAKKKAESRRGGDWFRMKKPGEVLIYVGGVTRDEDDLPYLETFVHYLGPKRFPCACLDLATNDVLTDDRVHAYLSDGEATVEGDCPACEEADKLWEEWRNLKDKRVKKETLDKAYNAASSVSRNRKFVFNIAVMAKRDTAEDEWDWVDKEELKLQPYSPGMQVWEQILDAFIQEGDITDPGEAIYLRLVKTGTKWHDITYKCTVYTGTVRKPFGPQKLPKTLKHQVDEKLHAEGELDLYLHVCDNVRTRADMEKLLSGIDVDEEDGDEDGIPTCYKLDYSDDEECKACRWRGPCAEACEVDLFPGHELKEGDEGYEADAEEPDPPKKKRGKKKADDAKETKKEKAAKKRAEAKAKKEAEAEEKAEREAEEEAKRKAEEEAASETSTDDEDEEEEEVFVVDVLKELGYDDRQIDRMSEETEDFLFENDVPATAVSVSKDGGYVLFKHKLPEDHELYEPEPEPEKEKPAAKKRRRRKKKTEEETPPEKGDDDSEEESEQTSGDDEESEGGDDMGLDDLERELRASAKKGGRKKK